MRIAARLALVGALGVLLALTLTPHNKATQARLDHAVADAADGLDVPREPKRERHRQIDSIGNVLLFLPLGFLGVLAFREHKSAVAAAGPLLSGAVELVQGAFFPHRDASLGDFAANSTGHLLGVAAALALSAATARVAPPGQGSREPAQ
jgi:VanZ family protein